jgi:hypothetical protein
MGKIVAAMSKHAVATRKLAAAIESHALATRKLAFAVKKDVGKDDQIA